MPIPACLFYYKSFPNAVLLELNNNCKGILNLNSLINNHLQKTSNSQQIEVMQYVNLFICFKKIISCQLFIFKNNDTFK
jgi:hypothetical protein